MKKRSIAFVLSIAVFICVSGFIQSEQRDLAHVEQRDGLYIFIQCKPQTSYNDLGTVKARPAFSDKAGAFIDAMIKNCKKEYPQADGLIFTTPDLDRAEAVKFK